MKGICNPEDVVEEFQYRELDIDSDREQFVKEHIGRWDFTAQEFSEDELVFGACRMLQHALDMPELEPWRLTESELRIFLLACRASYNSFVLYHNFRHAIDVLQSIFCFLISIGALPPHGPTAQDPAEKSPIASILLPFDALTLLISAIGHDVGHPGVNNFFLVKLNAPLAQLYNDNSVLEAFHCAAFSQILRRHWPSAFQDKQLRKLLISSILATDMGVHQKFMERLGQLQERFYENQKTLDGWKPQDIETYRTLICGLLIKCADISNVARPWTVAERWTKILQDEFANQGEMEKEVGMETALFGGPPEVGNVYKLATGQIGFMSIFAIPLFEGVSDLLPQMEFTVEQIRSNQSRWTQLADLEKRKQSLQVGLDTEDTPSPRTQSPNPAIRVGERRVDEDVASADQGCAASQPVPNDAIESAASSDPVSGAVVNENTISPVVSPDTPGPSIDITGSPYPPETPSRKSSCAVPDVTMVSLGGSPEGGDPSAQQTPDARAADTNRSPADPAVLAAVIFANAAKNEGEGQSQSTGETRAASERPSSSRHGQIGHRCQASRNSAGRTSGPSSSQRNSCTRTQSTSTYSNPMTPISPATNATSFLTADSGDEMGRRDSLSNSEHVAGETDNSQSGGRESDGPAPSHTSRQVDDTGKNSVTATVVGNGTASPAQSTTSAEGGKSETPESAGGGEQGGRRVTKRRSRLRLAFWRRKNHHSHQQEVGGET
jgi:3',5'-cyclic-nucleotide phosphodiesterase